MEKPNENRRRIKSLSSFAAEMRAMIICIWLGKSFSLRDISVNEYYFTNGKNCKTFLKLRISLTETI